MLKIEIAEDKLVERLKNSGPKNAKKLAECCLILQRSVDRFNKNQMRRFLAKKPYLEDGNQQTILDSILVPLEERHKTLTKVPASILHGIVLPVTDYRESKYLTELRLKGYPSVKITVEYSKNILKIIDVRI